MENKEIIAYKAFNNGLVNRYGVSFEIGKIYRVNGQVCFGNNGNGFHMCTYPEDCFRYFDTINNDIVLTQVRGFGNMKVYDDNYNGYYDMYVCECMEILKIISRDEFLDMMCNRLDSHRMWKFLATFHLNWDEILRFEEVYKNNETILKNINYYQKRDKQLRKRGVYHG